MDRTTLNPFSNWLSKTKGLPNTAIAKTPEQYLQLINKIAKKATLVAVSDRGSKAPKFNFGQCRYLAGKLKVVVERASPVLQNELNKESPREFLIIAKQLYGVAKKVESFINECCKDAWIQAAILLTNTLEHVLSIGLCLEIWAIFFSDHRMWGECQDAMLESVNRVEVEAVEKIASIDKDVLLRKMEAHLQSSTSSSSDGYLAAHLLGLLGANPAQEPVGLKFYELKDMSHLNQLESVGKGSAATVHRANLLGVEVAKKTFYYLDFEEFEKEVSILAGLSHPNITPMLCYAKGKRDCSIVMELMDEDLFTLIRRRLEAHTAGDFPFSLWEAVDIIFQVARGMHYLHEKNIVHRDVKSLNILVKYLKKSELAELECEYVLAKVSDFGLSKTKESSTRYSNQTPNIGTTRWMAPEVMTKNVEDMPRYPFKADVYSFAMVCYEILTGLEPFHGMRPNAIRESLFGGERIEKHMELPNWCPQKLRNLIWKCWSLDAKERPCFREICEVLMKVQCDVMGVDCEILTEFLMMDNLLKFLTSLDLRDRNPPNNIYSLKKGTYLDLRWCTTLQQLPKSIGNLNGLTSLNLGGCKSLQQLPESICNLTGLTRLNLGWCKSLQQLPESIGNMNGLKFLDLSWCETLQQLPVSIGNLNGLTSLSLSGCNNLQQLPEGIGNLNGLTSLDLEYCHSLQQLPESIGNVNGLKCLDLSWCETLQELPMSIGNLNGLTRLSLSRCSNLQQLPEGISNLNGLTSLILSRCSNLQQLPEGIGNLNGLTSLDLEYCHSLQRVPESIGNVNGLKCLDLSWCETLQELPMSIGNLNGLTSLSLSRCSNLQQLPEGIGNLNGLSSLDLEYCHSLQQLPESIGNVNGLKSLDLSWCETLQELPMSIGNLNGLTSLSLSCCSNLQQLPESISNLNGLTSLDLSNCKCLQQLPESIGNLNCLSSLKLSCCYSLQQLPESIGNLNGLKSLDLHECISLEQLPKSMSNLNDLTVHGFARV